MKSITKAYRKTAKVIDSCKTTPHFNGSKRMLANFKLIHGAGIHFQTLNYLYKSKKEFYGI